MQAPAAELHLGQCLAGIGSLDKAKAHWQAFLKAKPDGPWRGQAHVELIDLALEQEIDLPAAVLQSEIAQSALANITDADAKSSWDAAAFELHLRSALIALAQNRRTDAAQSFEKAKTVTNAPSTTLAVSRLDDLIASLKSDQDPLPADLRGPRTDEQVNVLLTLGSVYNRLGRHDSAKRILASLGQGKLQAKVPVQGEKGGGRKRGRSSFDGPFFSPTFLARRESS
ncbi:MAG: hypothetical protein WED34_17950 [Planctomycetales bacterium]